MSFRSKKEIYAYGTLYATYSFRVFIKKKRGFRTIYRTYRGNDTQYQVRGHTSVMFRHSLQDCTYQMRTEFGNSTDYDAKLTSYYFIYWEDKARNQKSVKQTKTHYNNEIPETLSIRAKEDIYRTIIIEREQDKKSKKVTTKRSKHKTRVGKSKKKLTKKSSIIEYQKSKEKKKKRFKHKHKVRR